MPWGKVADIRESGEQLVSKCASLTSCSAMSETHTYFPFLRLGPPLLKPMLACGALTSRLAGCSAQSRRAGSCVCVCVLCVCCVCVCVCCVCVCVVCVCVVCVCVLCVCVVCVRMCLLVNC